MNNLIEKLETQKTRLPQEDHSIIDWAISAIRIRIKQREEIMDEITEGINEINRKFCKNIEHSNPQQIYTHFTNSLVKIIDKGSFLEYEDATKKGIRNLTHNLNNCLSIDSASLGNILKNSSDFCHDKANEIEQMIKDKKIKKLAIESATKLVENYKQASKDLINSN